MEEELTEKQQKCDHQFFKIVDATFAQILDGGGVAFPTRVVKVKCPKCDLIKSLL